MKNKINIPLEENLPTKENGLLKWFWFFTYPTRVHFFLIFISRFIRFFLVGLVPLFIGQMINVFESGQVFKDTWAFWQIFIILSVIQVGVLFDDMTIPYHRTLQAKICASFSLFCLNYMSKLPLSWHNQNGSGTKIQRIETAKKNLSNLVHFFALDICKDLGNIIGLLVSIYFMNAPLIFILLLVLYCIIYILVGWYFVSKSVVFVDSANKELEILSSKIYEFISSISILKLFNLKSYLQAKANESEDKILEANYNRGKVGFKKWFSLGLIAYVFFALSIILAFYSILDKKIEVSAFATIVLAMTNAKKILSGFTLLLNVFVVQKTSFLRIKETLTQKPENVDFKPFVNLDKKWKKISFENVGFVYKEENKKVFDNFNLTINQGERIGIVGSSGAGKSTLINLLMKQNLVDKGVIKIDGVDIKNIKQDRWLEEFAVVPQSVSLFNLSIEENILLNKKTSKAKFNKYIKLAYADEFVNEMPLKSQSIIGEKGVKLSGGQAQRIGIARALAKEANIMIFDEATSALDSQSEKYIQKAIDNSFANKTLVVIAHRLSTLKNMDRIIVLDKGKVAEIGSHKKLISKKGLYYKMWQAQYKDE